MPAMLDDPMSPTIYRTSGAPPYPDPSNPQPALPAAIVPRQVTLRDRVTVATILPFSSRHQVPPSLLTYLCAQLNKEIEGGDTYPMVDPMPYDKFASYWFQNFGAVMLLGNIERAEDVVQDWSTSCLGSFYIKPNYPGRSSHVCNAGFLVTDAARNRGVGRLMGETYIDWAPKLGYTYSVFNLVYETNVASCRIWDALGFKRIGRVKGCGNLKSYPDQLIDAIIYGRDLGPEGEDLVSEERFDKIKFYLKFGKYPNGADRAEKSRLRSAATHYKLLDGDKLMLKDKEVISDPKRQYEIARKVHLAQHGGINKTTATIAEMYHWIRIKETVSLVIKNCDVCKETGKVPVVRPEGVTSRRPTGNNLHGQGSAGAGGRLISLQSLPDPDSHSHSPNEPYGDPFNSASLSILGPSSTSPHSLDQSAQRLLQEQVHHHMQPRPHQPHESPHQCLTAPITQMHQHHHSPSSADDYIALDPQIMEDVRNHLGNYMDDDQSSHTQASPYHNPFQSMLTTPHPATSPHIQAHDHHHHHIHHHHHSQTHNPVDDVDDDDDGGLGDAHNNDLDMLIEDDDVDEQEQQEQRELEQQEQERERDREQQQQLGSMDDEEEEEEEVKGRVQAQMAAMAAEAAMREEMQDGKAGEDERGYGGLRYRNR